MQSTYVLRYGGLAEVKFRDAFEKLGWEELDDDDSVSQARPGLILQPHTRIDWSLVLDGKLPVIICGSYPVRTALVRKDVLARTLESNSSLKGHFPKSVIVGETSHFSAIQFPFPWFIKVPSANNATGLHIVRDMGEAHSVFLDCTTKGNCKALVVQEFIGRGGDSPTLFLHQGRKFHARVNVLAVSACAVYVHRDVVCHVACEDYVGTSGGIFSHITNHVLQRKHTGYLREKSTLLHSEVFGEDSESVFVSLCELTTRLFGTVVSGKTLRWTPLHPLPPSPDSGETLHAFLPAPNCFEVFGFDVLFVERKGSVHPILIEVNAGPALEGLALPTLCSRVTSDIVELVCGGITEFGWSTPPIPTASNGFLRVM